MDILFTQLRAAMAKLELIEAPVWLRHPDIAAQDQREQLLPDLLTQEEHRKWWPLVLSIAVIVTYLQRMLAR